MRCAAMAHTHTHTHNIVLHARFMHMLHARFLHALLAALHTLPATASLRYRCGVSRRLV